MAKIKIEGNRITVDSGLFIIVMFPRFSSVRTFTDSGIYADVIRRCLVPDLLPIIHTPLTICGSLPTASR